MPDVPQEPALTDREWLLAEFARLRVTAQTGGTAPPRRQPAQRVDTVVDERAARDRTA